jgi:hypothetical protein
MRPPLPSYWSSRVVKGLAITLSVITIIGWSLLISLLALGGCQPRPRVVPPPTPYVPYPTCAGDAGRPVTAGVCDGAFTVDGWPCVRCAGARGCVDMFTGIYCVASPDCSDPACRSVSLARRPAL